MIVRLADMETDALAIVDGARDFISRMDYREFLPETEEDIIEETGRIITLPGVEVMVVERDDEIIGGFGMLYSPFLWNSKLRAAEELFWWTRQDAPNTTAMTLLKAVVERMRELHIQVALFREPIGTNLGQVYRRMGLRQVEVTYMGAL